MKLKKIAFLDRDGVINSKEYNNGYIGDIKKFKWIKGAIKTIKFLKKKNIKLLWLLINQALREVFLEL